MNTLSPTFTKAIECDYFFEEVTQVRFEVRFAERFCFDGSVELAFVTGSRLVAA